MAFISVESHLPGVTGLLEFRQDTAQPIRELTQFLLRGANTLSEAERELIATVVSSGNECVFCTTAHVAVADKLLGEKQTSQMVLRDVASAPVTPRLKALLGIAHMVRESGTAVTVEAIAKAKAEGCTDLEIHDTVLIAALFCLYNRYVDGLATALPSQPGYYEDLAGRLVSHGYTRMPQAYENLRKSHLKT